MMTRKDLYEIPIREIRIVNPRTRNRQIFQSIVNSISTVGLKKPITVVKRATAEDGTEYDLVCGQGRMEAFVVLGQETIPANVIDASKEDQLVMSLVENIARRPPSCKDLFREVSCLKGRGYVAKEIAFKLGLDVNTISAIDRLIEQNEADLVEAVEANRIPLTIALRIASSKEPEIQRALAEAYESGELRGTRFKEARHLIAARAARNNSPLRPPQNARLTGRELVREYERRTREQQDLVKRALRIRERLLLLKSAMTSFLADADFLTLLRDENLQDIPAELVPSGRLEE
jgi:ParB family chromosome partitioning protein